MSGAPDNTQHTFLHHLAELRLVVIRCFAALAAGMAVAGWFAPRLLAVLTAPLYKTVANPAAFLQSFEITSGMSVALQTAFWGGLILSLPAIVALAGAYVIPALTTRERRMILAWTGVAGSFFAAGVLFAYFVMLPVSIRALLWCNEWMGIPVQFITIASYVRFALVILAGFGLTFELPVILLILGFLGVLDAAQLSRYRPHTIVAVLLLAALITPTTDPVTQLLLAVPLLLLNEVAIAILRFREKRNRSVPSLNNS